MQKNLISPACIKLVGFTVVQLDNSDDIWFVWLDSLYSCFIYWRDGEKAIVLRRWFIGSTFFEN